MKRKRFSVEQIVAVLKQAALDNAILQDVAGKEVDLTFRTSHPTRIPSMQ